MGLKEDSVQAAKDAMEAAQDSALSALFDAGASSGSGDDDGINQGTVDSAVAAQKAQDDADKMQALADSMSAAQADHAAMQSQLDAANSAGQMSAELVKGFQDSYDSLKAKLDAFKSQVDAILNPPAPQPPVDVPPVESQPDPQPEGQQG